jgi:hypothetical protein
VHHTHNVHPRGRARYHAPCTARRPSHLILRELATRSAPRSLLSAPKRSSRRPSSLAARHSFLTSHLPLTLSTHASASILMKKVKHAGSFDSAVAGPGGGMIGEGGLVWRVRVVSGEW